MIGHARVAARVLAMILAFNAGAARAAEVGHGIAPMAVGAAIGILAMDAGCELVFAAERRRLKRWADKAIAAHEQETALRARWAAARRATNAHAVAYPPAPPDPAPPRSLRLLRPPKGDRPC